MDCTIAVVRDGLQNLRYYERRSLQAEPERSLGGHRLYRPTP